MTPSQQLSVAAPWIVRGRMRTPRILYMHPYWPHRATNASELRALNVGRALLDVGRVEVIVVDAEGGESEWAVHRDKEFKVTGSVPVHRRPERNVLQRLKWVLNPRSLYPHGCGVGGESLRQVLRSAAEFDLIWFCKLRTAQMFPQWTWPRSVGDIDDVPSTYVRSVQQTELTPSDRLQTLIRLWSWRRRDRLLGERFSVLGVCSETDERYLRALGVKAPVHVIPNGSYRPAATPTRSLASPPRLGFIGIFDYPPNLEGIRWFASKCWPRIKREVPDARLRLVGRFSDGPLKPAGPDIDGLGWVPDAAEEISTWSAMVVPVQMGAGTRGKIAHGFSLKCPIVSTSLGAYGYEAENGRTMYLANSVEDFSIACLDAIRRPDAAEAMAERAWNEFLEKWTWDAIRPRVWAAVEDCLRQNETPATDWRIHSTAHQSSRKEVTVDE
jgi:glycosyltransferase involved in cell wall biosynthesis